MPRGRCWRLHRGPRRPTPGWGRAAIPAGTGKGQAERDDQRHHLTGHERYGPGPGADPIEGHEQQGEADSGQERLGDSSAGACPLASTPQDRVDGRHLDHRPGELGRSQPIPEGKADHRRNRSRRDRGDGRRHAHPSAGRASVQADRADSAPTPLNAPHARAEIPTRSTGSGSSATMAATRPNGWAGAAAKMAGNWIRAESERPGRLPPGVAVRQSTARAASRVGRRDPGDGPVAATPGAR